MQEHRIDVGGRTVYVAEAGEPEGHAVFCLHGTPGSRLCWHEVVEDAAKRGIRLIAYDRPGYGSSDPDPGRSVADAADDIAAIADALGVERVGMGQDNLDEFGATLEGEEPLRRYLAEQREAMLGGSPEAIAESLTSLLCPPDLACLTGDLARYFYDQIAEGLRSGVDGWVEDDFVFVKPWGFEFDEVSVPVQVWHGVQDQFVPVAHGRWLAERIPGAEEHLYAEDGHLTLQIARIGDVHAWLASHF